MFEVNSEKAKWIWYPGDFEIECANKFMTNRYERDVFIPPFWKLYSCHKNVKFVKNFALAKGEKIRIRAEGKFNIQINGGYVYNFDGTLELGSGNWEMVISIYNDKGIPALYVEGDTVFSDESWQVTCNDHKYFSARTDEELVHGNSTPNRVKLPVREYKPERILERDGRKIYDFGKEIFACVRFSEAHKESGATVYYGESLCEAEDIGHCELLSADFRRSGGSLTTKIAKAFRYLTTEGLSFSELTALSEYLPMEKKSYFRCSDDLLNEIYEKAEYTLSLNTREFLIDGIKRDRWIWSGDAYQSYLMHYYSYFHKSVIKRTMSALFGCSPFELYLNHIMDYSFFWVMGMYDYFQYTGDARFVGENLSKAFEVMEYALGRTDENGLLDSRKEDWVFVDWAELDNTGEVCFEQILLIVSLRDCAELAEAFGETARAERYSGLLKEKMQKLELFWDEEKRAYIYSRKEGKPDGKILRHPNVFAVLYDVCGEERKNFIRDNVLKNDEIPAITTPYMKFYEFAALCALGEQEYVLREIRNYWGGMLKEGATTFWEAYDSRETGPEKYAMYGRKYGKSLCHAWGASPLYLIGRYIVGLTPAGEEFLLEPVLAGLDSFEAQMPLREGSVKISVSKEKIAVYSDRMYGTLRAGGKSFRIVPGKIKEVAYS